jgi:predicted SAM-dependent methyltransferase
MGLARWVASRARKLDWAAVQKRHPLRLYAGSVPLRPEYNGWVGLSIRVHDHRNLGHDLTCPIPLPDASVDAFQAEDVFEHIPYDRLPPVVNEIFRVLRPGALFRLSVPDYGCDVLRARCVTDADGSIVFDPGGGGTREHPSHVWFPRIDAMRRLLEGSRFGREGRIAYLHYYEMDGTPVTRPIDYAKGHVGRTPDHDARVRDPYRPLSLVVDLARA